MLRRKKILLVSSAFYPELSPRSFRATELCKEFFRQGHDVTLITKYRNHDYSHFLSQFPITIKLLGKPKFPKLPESKMKPFQIIFRVVSRILLLLFEYPGIEEKHQITKMLKNEKGYDLMISFAVPHPVHWGVAAIRSKEHPIAGTWIADCGDPYMLARLDSFRKPFYFKYFEKRFCRKCDYITIPFKELERQFYPEFLSKMKVIPQGFEFSEIRLYHENDGDEKPVFVFSGSVIPGIRDLNLFLDFLTNLPMDFLFIIYTNQKRYFTKYKQALGDKLELRDYIDRISLIYELSKADFLVNVDTILDNGTNIEAIPSKLIDYALAERPILNINSSSLDKELVLNFLQKDYSGQRVIDKSKFEIGKVAREFLHLIQ